MEREKENNGEDLALMLEVFDVPRPKVKKINTLSFLLVTKSLNIPSLLYNKKS